MISYEIYKIIHILSILVVFIGLSAYAFSHRKIFGLFHGVGLVLILVSGFGLLARLGMVNGIPQWVWVKLGVWFVLGATYSIAKRKKLAPMSQVGLWLVLASIAVCMAILKPQLF
ncbi:hypothetical protein GW916_12115 [bacterium]|nr:hypothetical protein [bacterium]